jgi:hypothetical protein
MPGPKKNDKGEIEEAGDMVIYVAGYPAIYGKQPLYFKDPTFQARASDAGAEGQRPAAPRFQTQGRASRYEPHPETHHGRRCHRRPGRPGAGRRCYAAGARINTTKSIPVGLYWTSSAPVEKGAYVLFCPPQGRRVR